MSWCNHLSQTLSKGEGLNSQVCICIYPSPLERQGEVAVTETTQTDRSALAQSF